MIKLLIMGQTLSLVTHKVVAGSHNYLEVDATFAGKDWEGLYKWVHFSKDQMHYVLPMHHDRIEKEDHLDLTGGTWEVYVHGNDILEDEITERITTNIQYLEVESTYDDHIFPALTPEFEEVLANEVEKAITIAQGVRNDADEGLFDGGTFIPEVSEEGIISWTNNRDRDNPEPRDIKGPKGDTGDTTVQVSTEEPTDPRINVWINPEGIVGKVIMDFQQISGDHQPGTYDVYMATFSDETQLAIPIYNGADGDGTGDMLKAAYDPRNISQDVYQYAQNAAAAAAAAAAESKAEAEDLSAHIQDKNNPHEVTADQLNLAAVATSGSYNDLKDTPSEPVIIIPHVTTYEEAIAAESSMRPVFLKRAGSFYSGAWSISRSRNAATGKEYCHFTALTEVTRSRQYIVEQGTNKWEEYYYDLFQRLSVIEGVLPNRDEVVTSNGIYNALQAKQDKLTIDSAMSATSTNPVQNKAVKQYIDSKSGGSDIIVERVYTVLPLLQANNGDSGRISVAKSGYTPIAVAGQALAGVSTTNVARVYIEGTDVVYMRQASQYQIDGGGTGWVDILYKKN